MKHPQLRSRIRGVAYRHWHCGVDEVGEHDADGQSPSDAAVEPEPQPEDLGLSTEARIRPAPETRPVSHLVNRGGGGSGGESEAQPDADG
jgi:hypothetical protein